MPLRSSTPARCAARRSAAEPLRKHDVLLDRQVPDEVDLLVEHPDRPRAQARAVLLRAPGQALAVYPDHAAVGLVEAGEAAQQRRLARPRRPAERDDLARRDGQAHALQGERLVVADVEEPEQPVGLEHGGHRVNRSESVTIRHGSTLSAPLGPLSVRTTSRPLWKNAYCSTASVPALPVTASAFALRR